MGATTTWERWDSMLPDGTINPGEMTSFNHYAFGAIATWMHHTIGGLSPLTPGYRSILIAPTPGADLTWARTSLLTPHGPAESTWTLIDNQLTVTATIPTGATAVIRLPGRPETTVGSGTHTFTTEH
ncbi:alpha-L-rhamnosidase C-terminal domain-containing protein [Nocardia macrotermitis]|uniref:alpha-L-rhamnosidase C-terminal domain-containing protein n=1 Tax=Nocardia macrotermitis TaxID=2585198 RepID=UPI00222882A2|nr:alpha-L-rhamnosidase C-terminal domain-containing protein [Nocardia macrotermitis]